MSRDITLDFGNFIHIFDLKQKLELYKLKSAICNWTLVITASAILKMRIKLSFMVSVLQIYKLTKYYFREGYDVVSYGVRMRCSRTTNQSHQHFGTETMLITHADRVGRRGYDVNLRLFVCLFDCLSVCPQHNSKTNDPKVFRLGIGISQK